ncbi:MAG: hypothetical protein ACLTTO_07165 [Lachnospiraceae bacterium]
MEKVAQEWERCGKPILLLSGGQGDGESITEAECMKRFLVEKGIQRINDTGRRVCQYDGKSAVLCNRLSDCKEKKTGSSATIFMFIVP